MSKEAESCMLLIVSAFKSYTKKLFSVQVFFSKPSRYTCPINIKINMTMTAINPKNQKQLNKAIKYLTDHNAYDLKRNEAEGNDDIKAYKKYDRLCESTFDKYLDAIEFLPKNQVAAIMKSELY